MIYLKLILSLCSILIIGVHFLYRKRHESYYKTLYFKRCGIICSKCSEHLMNSQEFQSFDGWEIEDNLKECKSCHRNYRLNLLMNFSSIKYKFDKWILSKKSEKILLSCILIPIPFVIASIFIENKLFSNSASIINSCWLITYWLISTYRVYLCRVPVSDYFL